MAEVILSEKKPLSRSEREANIKDKAGWLITVLAALLAINTYISSGNSSKVLNNTISANNTWAFYQAKSIKQTLAEQSLDDATFRKDTEKMAKLQAKIDRYESEPATGEGKKELFAKARALEAERDQIRKSGPWMTFAGSAFQIAIVLLTASILAVSMSLYFASIGVGLFAALLMSQGLWLWLPIVL
jgi:ABC-type multidrug transport system fused ATPase/permease subunit